MRHPRSAPPLIPATEFHAHKNQNVSVLIFTFLDSKQENKSVLNWMPLTWKSTRFVIKSCSLTVSNYKTVTITPKSSYSQHQLYLNSLDEREGVDEHYDKPEPCNNEVRARQSSRLNMQPVPTVCLSVQSSYTLHKHNITTKPWIQTSSPSTILAWQQSEILPDRFPLSN